MGSESSHLNVTSLIFFLDDKWSAKLRMKLSGARSVFQGEMFCGKPDSVVYSELVREAERVCVFCHSFVSFLYVFVREFSRAEYFFRNAVTEGFVR